MFHYPMNYYRVEQPYTGYPTQATTQQAPMQQMQYQAPPQFPTQVQVPDPAGAVISMNGTQQGPGQNQQQPTAPPQATPQGLLPLEQSYIENILRFNLGKMVTVYMTFEYSPEWAASIFRGILDEAGRDHIIIRNEETGKSYLLLMVNLDYVEFDEPIEYVPPALSGFVQSAPAR